MNIDKNRIIESFKTCKTKNILVVGDIIIDHYINSYISKTSEESPISILENLNEYYILGGASNVANNLSEFKINVYLCGLVGNDKNKNIFKKLCKNKNINFNLCFKSKTKPTITKTRIVSKGKQILRIDKEDRKEINKKDEDKIIQKIKEFNNFDLIILSDYNKGFLTKNLISKIIEYSKDKNIPVLIDPKFKKLEDYKNCNIITPNLKELEFLYGSKIDVYDDNMLWTLYKHINKKFNINSILLTISDKGMILLDSSFGLKRITTTSKNVHDVTGAGDTVISSLAFGLINNFNIYESSIISNIASGISVEKFGTSTINQYELLDKFGDKKIIRNSTILKYKLKYWRNKNKKIVFTNGCFDLLHSGHLKLLKEASKFGDILLIGLNSDKSVKLNKGINRPIIDENERIEILSSIEYIDGVILFDDKTPLKLINYIKPDILIKGSDYSKNEIIGKELIESYGGLIETIDIIKEKSSTSIIEKIKSLETN